MEKWVVASRYFGVYTAIVYDSYLDAIAALNILVTDNGYSVADVMLFQEVSSHAKIRALYGEAY